MGKLTLEVVLRKRDWMFFHLPMFSSSESLSTVLTKFSKTCFWLCSFGFDRGFVVQTLAMTVDAPMRVANLDRVDLGEDVWAAQAL